MVEQGSATKVTGPIFEARQSIYIHVALWPDDITTDSIGVASFLVCSLIPFFMVEIG